MHKINFLLIDDHRVMIDGYKGALKRLENKYTMLVREAFTIDHALHCLKIQPITNPYNIAFVDINLPASYDQLTVSGEQVALKIKERFPQCKIIIPTSYEEAYRIHTINSVVKPDAILLKSEFVGTDIINAVTSVLSGEVYYTKKVKKIIRALGDQINLNDIKLLYHLSKGVKMKDMIKYIPDLKLRSIEERKSNLKLLLGAESNEELLEKAQEKGLL